MSSDRPMALVRRSLTSGPVAAGIAAGALTGELRGARIVDWHRAVAIGACGGVVLLGLGFAADTIDGRWDAPDRTWAETLAFARQV